MMTDQRQRPVALFPISVILPVRNEEASLASCLASMKTASSASPVEIIVVDGHSTDRSTDIARQCGAVVLRAPSVGRAGQMHWGACHASGDLLVFVHADSALPPHWISRIEQTFGRSQSPPAAAAFSIEFDSRQLRYKALSTLANLRSRLTGLPHGDQALVVTRQAYFSAGGFPNVPLMEEYLLVPRLKRIGPIEQFRDRVVTSCRRYQREGVIRLALKKSVLIALYYAGVSPARLARWYW